MSNAEAEIKKARVLVKAGKMTLADFEALVIGYYCKRPKPTTKPAKKAGTK